MRRLVAACLAVILFAPAAQAERVVVFAASSLKAALDEIAVVWQAETGDEAVIAYGGSGAMAQQILQGAPAEVFISANPDWMDVVGEAGLLDAGSRVDLLGNRLVLIGPAGSPQIEIGPVILDRLGEGRLALGQTASVPAGIYARAALVYFDLWDDIAPRLIETENVAAAARLVALGNAPLGIVYRSDAAGLDSLSVLATFPQESHPPIVYPAAVLAGAPAQADAFVAFLQGQTAQDVFARNGFPVPAP